MPRLIPERTRAHDDVAGPRLGEPDGTDLAAPGLSEPERLGDSVLEGHAAVVLTAPLS